MEKKESVHDYRVRHDVSFQALCNSFPLRPIKSEGDFKEALEVFRQINHYRQKCPKDAVNLKDEIEKYLGRLEMLIDEFGFNRGFLQQKIKEAEKGIWVH